MLTPDYEKARSLARPGTIIPVFSTILADTETPVTVWLKLFSKSPWNFVLESVTGGEHTSRYSFIGGDPYLRFSATRDTWRLTGSISEEGTGNPLERLRALFAARRAVPVEGAPPLSGGAVGFFGYDTVRLVEDVPDANPDEALLDDIFFGFYRDLVAFDNREHRLLLCTNIFVDEETDFDAAWKDASHRLGRMEDRLAMRLPSHRLSIGPSGPLSSNFSRNAYEDAVRRCKEYIRAGDIFQVVLSQRFCVPVQAAPFDLYRVLRTINPSPYMYYLGCDKAAVIGASPEMLVRVMGDRAETCPIAGTRPRGRNDAEDEHLAADLLQDAKERAEHIMLVDLGRNDLGRVCSFGSVHVEEMMHIEKYSHVMHLVSNVSGTLLPVKDAFDALFACFPAGTLSGAPKIRAMEIIDELEPLRRGLYGGALGYIDFHGNIDSCIVIRTIIFKDNQAVMQAGAGIVADSVPAREFEETVNKAGALFAAIKRAAQIAGGE